MDYQTVLHAKWVTQEDVVRFVEMDIVAGQLYVKTNFLNSNIYIYIYIYIYLYIYLFIYCFKKTDYPKVYNELLHAGY